MDRLHDFWDWSTRDSYDWLNLLLAVVGFGLTIVAIFQATGAKRAATGAREAVWRRTASAEFQRLANLGAQLDFYAKYEKRVETAAINSILRPAYSEARRNFESELATASKKDLDEIELSLNNFSNWLTTEEAFEAHLQDIKTSAAASTAALSGLAGQLQQRERK
jgi:hypothetical protein